MTPELLKRKLAATRQHSTLWVLNGIRTQVGLRSTRKLAGYLTQTLGMCQTSVYHWIGGKTKAPKRAHRALVLLYVMLTDGDPSREIAESEDLTPADHGGEVDFDSRRVRI